MGLAEAAKACGVSISTLRRRKETLVAAGATVSDKGWQIPIPALVSLGFLSSTTPGHETVPTVEVTPSEQPNDDTPVRSLVSEMEVLRRQLAEAETRAQVAEAIAAERERIIDAQAITLRMLEAIPVATPSTTPSATPSDTPVSNTEEPPANRPERHSKRRWRGFLGMTRSR